METIMIRYGSICFLLQPNAGGFEAIRTLDDEVIARLRYTGAPDAVWEGIGREFGWFADQGEPVDLEISWNNGSSRIKIKDESAFCKDASCQPSILFDSNDELWLFIGKRFGYHC